MSIPFFYVINKKKTLTLIGILVIFLAFSVAHYELVSRVNDYFFNIAHLWSYVKFYFYLFIYLALYYFFDSKDFFAIIKTAKFIVLVLFIESLFFLIFKTLGFSSLAGLFDSVGGRFSGIFLMHNTLVGLFALFVMSYFIYFGSLLEKYVYLTIGIFLILLTGERSLSLALLFLVFAYVLFSFDQNTSITKNKIKLSLSFSLFLVGFVVLYTIYIRGYDIQSFGEFLRPITLRLYYSYLSIVHVFESNSSIIGFGPFIENLPTNYFDMYSDYVEKFINIVTIFFGEFEEAFFRDFHDYGLLCIEVDGTITALELTFVDAAEKGKLDSICYFKTHIVNAHNTFVLLFFKFGYFFIGLLFYFLYLLIVSFHAIRQNASKFYLLHTNSHELQNKKEFFFLLPSLTFIISCFPSLIFLSMDNYLILVAIGFGQIGSYMRQRNHE